MLWDSPIMPLVEAVALFVGSAVVLKIAERLVWAYMNYVQPLMG